MNLFIGYYKPFSFEVKLVIRCLYCFHKNEKG
jgi:hypothetical protein